jgi:catechol 2,3-dioxygenase-like lactoylglutathione lyase family enzyme
MMSLMAATFNHTIIAARDPKASAEFYRTLLEARDAPPWGPFSNLLLDDGVLLQFADPSVGFTPVHLAFLLDDDHFTGPTSTSEAPASNTGRTRSRPGEPNTEHRGRGVYLLDPSGNYLELITRPYL